MADIQWQETKEGVLNTISDGRSIKLIDSFRNKWQVGEFVVHVRQVARPKVMSDDENGEPRLSYGFSILDNSLDADFELWICGEPYLFHWLLPTPLIRDIYNDPDAYQDYSKTINTVVVTATFDVKEDYISYGRKGKIAALPGYRNTIDETIDALLSDDEQKAKYGQLNLVALEELHKEYSVEV